MSTVRYSIALLLLTAPMAAAADESSLGEAAKTRDIAAVRLLLSRRVNVNAPLPDGATALHWAAHWNDAEMAELLVRAGVNVDATNRHGVTPLWLACVNDSAKIVELLLSAGAQPNLALPTGETPLMRAARSGQVDAVGLLLTRGAHVDAIEPEGEQTALMWAMAEGHAMVGKALMAAGANVNARSKAGFTPLLFATRRGDLESVRVLLDAGARVNEATSDNRTALLAAVINGQPDIVDLLLEKGADANIEGSSTGEPFTDRPAGSWGTPLHAVVHMGNWETTPIHFALDIQRKRIASALLAHGANPNAPMRNEPPRWGGAYYASLTGATPFLLAAKAGDVELMRLLLSHGADPTIATKDKTVPLIAAAGFGYWDLQGRNGPQEHLTAVKLLLELGADVNATNDSNVTALHGAAFAGWNPVVELLVAAGARMDVKDKLGRTPLTLADGIHMNGSNIARPETAALLRRLGAGTQ